MGAQRENERKYRSGETLLNSVLQQWNLFFAIFIFLFSCRQNLSLSYAFSYYYSLSPSFFYLTAPPTITLRKNFVLKEIKVIGKKILYA